MAASIESRVPFLDHELVEHVAAMPGRLQAPRAGGPRPSCARRCADVRAAGDPHPAQDGLPGAGRAAGCAGRSGRSSRSSCSGRARSRAGSSTRPRCGGSPRSIARGAAEHGDRLWLLVNLEIWQRIFLDGDEPAAITDGLSAHAHPLGEGRAGSGRSTRAAASAASTRIARAVAAAPGHASLTTHAPRREPRRARGARSRAASGSSRSRTRSPSRAAPRFAAGAGPLVALAAAGRSLARRASRRSAARSRGGSRAASVDVCVADFLAGGAERAARRPRRRSSSSQHNVEHMIWKRLARGRAPPLAAGAARARVAEDAPLRGARVRARAR